MCRQRDPGDLVLKVSTPFTIKTPPSTEFLRHYVFNGGTQLIVRAAVADSIPTNGNCGVYSRTLMPLHHEGLKENYIINDN